MKKLYPLLMALFCVLTVTAQPAQSGSFSIKGQVVDSLTNETVPFATLSIALQSEPDKPVTLLACDMDGKFQSALKSSGSYVMTLQSVGKQPTQKQFTLSDTNKSVDLGKIYMGEDSQELGEVSVVAQKPLVKVDIDKLTYSIEDDPESQTNTTLDMLRKVPMVTVDGDDKIQLKGSSNYKIYLNGKPSNMLSGDNASDVLKGMPASSVKNIEVITDPGAKFDAEGVGGIINIITTKNALQGYTGTVRAGVSAMGRYNAGGNITTKVGKLGVNANYGFNYNNTPWNDSESYRENYGDHPSIVSQKGRSKYKGPFNWGSLELSYELDSLNLISVGGNMWRGNGKNFSELDVVGNSWNNGISEDYMYRRVSDTKNTFGSIDMNIDFQHSTRKPDELLTISYRFSNSPNDSESHSDFEGVKNYASYRQWNVNDAATNEHTAQVDYTTPTLENQTLELGAKYIVRPTSSHTTQRFMQDGDVNWTEIVSPENDFKYTQHIYSGYVGYALKYSKFGVKGGFRAEGTSLNVKYALEPKMNFSNDYFDFVPNATISYQLSMAQQLRLGYNMRIYRPGIWHLNPYVNDTDPQNISYGNPDLKTEKSHNLNLNYSMFTPKFNINASVNYRFLNNAIQRYTILNEAENGRAETSYYNIGKNQSIGFFLYGRWAPVPLFNIFMNGGLDYQNIKSNVDDLSTDGFTGRIFAGAQFNLPKDFRIDLNGGYFKGWFDLQTKYSNSYFNSITFNKAFMDKKLNISLGVNNPFKKDMKYTSTISDPSFVSQNISFYRSRDFRISVSYRFGTFKDSIKKVRRGISNDDMKSGEGGSGGGEGGM